MNTTGKIALACFLGSFIGALMALQFHLFWWIGVIIGGVVGYVSYSFKEIPATTRRVWAKMPEPKIVGGWLKKGLGAIGLGLALLIFGVLLFVSICGSVILGFFSILQALGFFFHHKCSLNGLMYAGPDYWFWVGGTLLMYLYVFLDKITEEEGGLSFKHCVVIACTPALSLITVPVVILVCTLWVLSVIGKLLWCTTKLVHSDIRLLCMTDSLIGALVGYFTGNALIGGLVGCALGVINYKLVSVRFLKLAPQA